MIRQTGIAAVLAAPAAADEFLVKPAAMSAGADEAIAFEVLSTHVFFAPEEMEAASSVEVAFVDAEGSVPVEITEDEAAAVLRGAPAEGPSLAEARADPAGLLAHVLGRVYLAFGEREEGAIYDALAGVATGDVLEDLYLERRAVLTATSNAGEDAGGGQEIHGIEVLAAEATERNGAFIVEGRWETLGSVGHGEHVHVRGNRYAARMTMRREGGGWRLVAFELLDMVRAEAAR